MNNEIKCVLYRTKSNSKKNIIKQIIAEDFINKNKLTDYSIIRVWDKFFKYTSIEKVKFALIVKNGVPVISDMVFSEVFYCWDKNPVEKASEHIHIAIQNLVSYKDESTQENLNKYIESLKIRE